MPYGAESLKQISTCKFRMRNFLFKLGERVDKEQHPLLKDITITKGLRGKVEQNKDLAEGNSTKAWPESLHNNELLPEIPADVSKLTEDQKSYAADVAPYPTDWDALGKDKTPWMVLLYFAQRVIVENGWEGQIECGGLIWPHFVDEPHFQINYKFRS